MNSSYRQPEKNAVRDRILPSAIRILTSGRSKACIVQEFELLRTVEYFLDCVRRYVQSDRYTAATLLELREWQKFHSVQIGSRTPDSLKILYLCGPEPLNDLSVMLHEGVNPHNVWALTSEGSDYQQAAATCAKEGIPLKLHHGQLAEFFDVFNETFDIIYVDACGPIAGGKPNTIEPVIRILDRQRLISPGVLITNFSEPPDDGDQRERYVDLVTAFFHARYRDLPRIVHTDGPDPMVAQHDYEELQRFARKQLAPLYSEFISRLISDLGMALLPNCRALSMSALFRSYLAKETIVNEARARANDWEMNEDNLPGELVREPSTYPLVAFVRRLEQLRPNDPLLLLMEKPLNRQPRKLRDLVEASSMLSKVVEGHWEVLSAAMKRAVATSWFDFRARLTCDAPLPNLIVNSLLGLYGRPWFVNPVCSDRVTYCAKRKRMYCDMFVLDQCRSYFDWFPTVDSCPSRFESIPFQIVARCILDRIGRHNFDSETHPFHGASVCSKGEIPEADWYTLKDRLEIL